MVVFFGDFNYRLHDISYDEARDFVSQRSFDWLREKDQLRAEMKAGRVFQGMREGLIKFPPTYKFERHIAGFAGILVLMVHFSWLDCFGKLIAKEKERYNVQSDQFAQPYKYKLYIWDVAFGDPDSRPLIVNTNMMGDTPKNLTHLICPIHCLRLHSMWMMSCYCPYVNHLSVILDHLYH